MLRKNDENELARQCVVLKGSETSLEIHVVANCGLIANSIPL